MILRLPIVLIALPILAGCGTTIDFPVDSGTSDGSPDETAFLVLQTDESMRLVFGQVEPFAVQYLEQDMETPIPDATMRFALDGRAHDSTLSQVDTLTDSNGVGIGSVIAGTQPTAFRIRITADRAAARFINVSVSDLGFGTLEVTTIHDGMRPVVGRTVMVYAGLACDELADAGDPDRMRSVSEDADAAIFEGLPVGVSHAVAVEGLSEAGEVVAYGCVDGAMVLMDDTVPLEVTVSDLPLASGGLFETRVDLDSTVPAATLDDTVRSAASGVLGGLPDEEVLLDALEMALRDAGETAVADTLAADRGAGLVDPVVARRLSRASAGPSLALDAAVALLVARTARLTLEGEVQIEPDATARDGWRTMVVTISGSAGGDGLMLDPAALADTRTGPVQSRTVPDEDALVLSSISVPLRLGSLGREAIAALAAEGGRGETTLSGLLRPSFGCEPLIAWADTEPAISAVCDRDCVLAACERVLFAMVVAVEIALTTLDDTRQVVALSGRADIVDDDGDLAVDSLMAPTVDGRWTATGMMGGDTMSGSAEATRLPDVP